MTWLNLKCCGSIAPLGQAAAQAPQPLHSALFISDIPSAVTPIAPYGHMSWHTLHPEQSSSSMMLK